MAPATMLQAQTTSCPLDCRANFGSPVVNPPPLDVPVYWQRRHTVSGPPGHTHGILALVSEATGAESFPWPLYIQLTASHEKGDAVGSYVRLTKSGAGWGASFHTDLYHSGTGTSVAANLEVTKRTDTGRAIGVNIQSKGTVTNEGINFQTAPGSGQAGTWETALRFERGISGNRAIWIEGRWNTAIDVTGTAVTGLHFDRASQGTRAIWIEGQWGTGIDLGSSSLAMSSGSRIFLDTQRRASIRFDPVANAIELGGAPVVMTGGSRVVLDSSRQILINASPETNAIEFGESSLALRTGARVYLDSAKEISILFNPETNAIEFRKGEAVLFSIPTMPE